MCEMVVLEAVVQWCSVKKVFLGIPQISQVFSCEFCEISKNTFFHRAPSVAASVVCACPAFHSKNNRQEKVANISEKQL